MEIVYEGKAAGKRPPRGIKVQGGELSRAYEFSPTGEPVEVPDQDASHVLALRPAHGRFRALGGEQTPGGVQVAAGAADGAEAGEAGTTADTSGDGADGPATDTAHEVGEGDADCAADNSDEADPEGSHDEAPVAQPLLGGSPAGDPVTRNGRKRGRSRRDWTAG